MALDALGFSAQARELLIAYGLSAGGMLAGLVLLRANRSVYWRLPAYSVMVMAVSVVLWNLLRKHLLPADVTTTQSGYYTALGLYALMGFLFGLGVGRITRPRPPPQGTDDTGDDSLR